MTAFEEAHTEAVTRVQIARYAGAVGDFNPIHVDDEFARSVGLPSVIAHGPLTLALVIDRLVDQLGVDALQGFDARLQAPVVPGDVLTAVPTEQGLEIRNGAGTVVAKATLHVKSA